MSAKKRALGRGLDALLGSREPPDAAPAAGPATTSQSPSVGVKNIPFVRLHPNPWQPRRHFDDAGLEELCASIRANGILQPILARQRGEDYEIVAGERRWRAAQLAELAEAPVIVREFSDQEMLELALQENLQRQDLNPIEEAMAYQKLIDAFGLTQEQVAERIGKSRVAVTNALRLLRLAEVIREWIEQGRLSAGHARALLGLENEDARMALARQVMAHGLSVREAERRARRLAKGDGNAQTNHYQQSTDVAAAALADVSERLSLHLGRRVRVIPESNDQGRIEIHYASLEEFQGILEQLGMPVEQEI
jgi:ParB family chromosome partitioning protein